jgi:hypothetical protein
LYIALFIFWSWFMLLSLLKFAVTTVSCFSRLSNRMPELKLE